MKKIKNQQKEGKVTFNTKFCLEVQEKLVQNYDDRIKEFVIHMASSPLKIKDYHKQISSVRQEYLNQGNEKIIGKKGFIFTTFKTEKQRLEDLMKEKEIENEILKTASDCSDSKMRSTSRLDTSPPEFLQPSMRFKARTDLERIVDAVNSYSFGRANYDIINKQLKELDLNVGRKSIPTEREITEEIPDYSSSIVKRMEKKLLLDKQNEELKKLQQSITEKKKNIGKKKLNNSQARHLLRDLHYKTHFKGATGFYLFKKSSVLHSSFFKEKKLENKNDEHESYMNSYYYPAKTETNFNSSSPMDKINKMKIQLKNDSESYGFNRAKIQKNKLDTSGKHFLTDPDISEEIMQSNPLLYNMNINFYKKKQELDPENIDMDKLQTLRDLAFPKKSENNNYFPIKKSQKRASFFNKILENKESFLNFDENDNFLRTNTNAVLQSIDKNPEYEKRGLDISEKLVKNEDDFTRNHIDKITKKVLTDCNFFHHKSKNNNSRIKVGQGKMMITSGLTVNDFMRKYNLNIK
jgi:hypothetical protein